MPGSDTFAEYAFVSIGSNLPIGLTSPLDIIAKTFASLEQLSAAPTLFSSIYVTSPIDSPPGTPDFYNAMAGILPGSSETPLSLLHKLQAIEDGAGRTRSGTRNEARTLDLDLITFKSEIVETDELVVPHPKARERRFVLLPLAEIAGVEFVLPGQDETLLEMLEQVSNDQAIKKL